MSFLSGKNDFKEPDQKLSGLDESRAATNEQARVVPYFAGRRILGVTHISELFNIAAIPRYVDTKKGDDQISGYYYQASFAALVCHGPVDALYSIYFDKKKVWEGNVTRGSADSEVITISGFGAIRIFWGTETQGEDADLIPSGENHPPYRGQCYIFATLMFGYQKTNCPQIELELGRWPEFEVLGTPANIDGDCNPVHFIYELATNPRFGARMAASRIHTTGLSTVAKRLRDEGVGLSPFINKQQTFREILITALEYFDGYYEPRADGKFSIGLARALAGDVKRITEADILSDNEPSIKVLAWDTTINDLRVRYSNRDLKYESSSEPYVSRSNLQITGRPLSKILDRPWITKQSIAAKIATASGRQLGLPKSEGSILIKKSSATGLAPGVVFWLCYCNSGINQLCRITEVNTPDPARPRVQIDFEIDRGYLNTDSFYIPKGEPPPIKKKYDAEPIKFSKIIEAPIGLRSDVYESRVGFLVARPTTQTNDLNIHRKRPSGTYESILQRGAFAVRGHLVEAYTASTTLIDNSLGMLIQLDGVDAILPTFPLSDALLNDYLIFVNGEIISMFGATLVAAGRYRVFGVRARYDTARENHATKSEVFIMRRKSLPTYIEPSDLNPISYKLQPFSLGSPLDLSSVDPVVKRLAYRGMRPRRPKNLRGNGQLESVAWNMSDDIEVTWSVQSYTQTPVSTLIEIVLYGGVIITETAEPDETSKTFSGSALAYSIGSNNFIIRAWHIIGEWKSLLSTELNVITIP